METAALAAADKLADGIIAYDVSEQLVITDAFVLCSASNDRQVRAIVDEIELRMRQAGAELIRREGEREGRWVLLDYLDVVVHVQHSEERTYYALERIWKDCPQIPLPELVSIGRNGRLPNTPRETAAPAWRILSSISSTMARTCRSLDAEHSRKASVITSCSLTS